MNSLQENPTALTMKPVHDMDVYLLPKIVMEGVIMNA